LHLNHEKEVIVIGHKNPDTDSICSAIAYADLKQKLTGKKYTPKRAGEVSKETAFALSYFGVSAPGFLADVRTRVCDMEIKEVPAVNGKISIKQAYSLMKENDASTVCITDADGCPEGLITISNIAASDMDVYDNRIVSKAKTPYENIVRVLEAKVICGDISGTFEQGRVTIAANTPEMMVDYVAEHDMVVIGNRFESQFFSIEMGASCIILCTNAEPNETIIERAEKKGCIILSSPYDSYTVARLINQSMPIDFFMTAHHILSFSLEDYTDDVKEVMARERHRYFPVLDEHGCYIGQISKRSFLATEKKQVVLVDHNEKNQAIDGVENADILEIIDHHRLGGLESINPVFFRNQPLGCTATIIYQMFCESGVTIERSIAGLLCSAILSDTLMFRSPTCTQADEAAAQALAEIAGIDIPQYAQQMFEAGSDLSSRSIEEIFYQDYKTFSAAGVNFGVGQITSVSDAGLRQQIPALRELMQEKVQKDPSTMLFFLLTNIIEESSIVLCCGTQAEEVLKQSNHLEEIPEEGLLLPGMVSRKKQFVPSIIATLQQ
jgi:manganese-dependent inorganic pyrophosphatase